MCNKQCLTSSDRLFPSYLHIRELLPTPALTGWDMSLKWVKKEKAEYRWINNNPIVRKLESKLQAFSTVLNTSRKVSSSEEYPSKTFGRGCSWWHASAIPYLRHLWWFKTLAKMQRTWPFSQMLSFAPVNSSNNPFRNMPLHTGILNHRSSPILNVTCLDLISRNVYYIHVFSTNEKGKNLYHMILSKEIDDIVKDNFKLPNSTSSCPLLYRRFIV